MKPSSFVSAVGSLARGSGADPMENAVAQALTLYLEQAESGHAPDIDQFAGQYPEIQDRLRECLRSLQVVNSIAGQFSVQASLADAPETRVALGDFQIVREIGRGGMGIVYEAEQLSLGRRVALKVLPFASLIDNRYLARFKNESRAAAMLKHPRIVSVIQTGCDRGVHYYAMDFVPGRSLATVIQELKSGGHLSTESREPADSSADTAPIAQLTTEYLGDPKKYCRDVAGLGIQVAEALEYAHQERVIHRDVKPSNLLLDDRGQVWITDFGLAHIQGAEDLTLTGDVLGTLRYMSPEQANGRNRKLLDDRTDVYSLGVTLYELLTLRPAFTAEDRQSLLNDISHTEPIPPRQLNHSITVELQTIVLKAMAKEPSDRYATAQDLADDLERFIEDRPIQARPLGRIARTWRWCRRSPAFAGLIAAVCLLLVCVTVSAVAFAFREIEHRAAAEATTKKTLWRQYLADMHIAARAWEDSQPALVRELLQRHVPTDGREDHRGFEWEYLAESLRSTDSAVTTLQDSIPIRTVAFSSDDRWFVTAGLAAESSIWDLTLRKKIRTIKAPTTLKAATISPDDRLIAYGCNDGSVRLFDAATGNLVDHLPFCNDWVQGIAFSPDGRWLSAVSNSGDLVLFDMSNNRERFVLNNTKAPKYHVTFSSDSKLLAATAASEVTLWDVNLRRELAVLRSYPAGLKRRRTMHMICVTFSPDHSYLASGDTDGVVNVWKLGDNRHLASLAGHTDLATSVLFASDNTLVSTSWDQTVRMWDIEKATEQRVLRLHDGHACDVTFTADERILVSAGYNGRVQLFDLNQPPAPAVVRANSFEGFAGFAISFSPNGRWLETDALYGVAVYDVETGVLVKSYRDDTQGRSFAFFVRFSSDGQIVWPTSSHLNIWDWQREGNGQSIRRISLDASLADYFDLSRDRRSLVTNDGNRATIWEWPSMIRRVTIESEDSDMVAVSPDSRLVFTTQYDGTISTWNASTGRLIRSWRAHDGAIDSLAVSPNGRFLASGGYDTRARVWEASTGKLHSELIGHRNYVSGLAFLPDERSIVAACSDRAVRIWEVDTGEERALFNTDCWQLRSVAVSPDGRTIAAVGYGDAVYFWRAGKPTQRVSHKR